MDNPLDAPMPSFDPDVVEPVPPKKPRPRPQRKKPARKAARPVSPPKPAPRKRSTAKRRKPHQAKPDIKLAPPRLNVMMDACTRIKNALSLLSAKEQESVLEAVRAS